MVGSGNSILIIRIWGRFMNKLYAFFGLEQIDRQTLDHLLHYLPPYRQEKALRYRQEIDRKTCVMAYLLLIHALYCNYGIGEPKFSFGSAGKSYLADHPDVHFNISHCPKGCICGISDSPIGVDIQDVRPFSQEIAKHCCSEDELNLLVEAANPAMEFTRMWAMKESYLKMTGAGITRYLSAIDTTKLTSKIQTDMYNGCCIAVASAESFLGELICLN